MERLTEAYYIEKIQAGETEHFTVLLERYSQPVFSLIIRIIGNREDAEELTQDVFLKVFRSLGSFQGGSSFSTWLYRIAYNTVISATRKKKQLWLSLEESMVGDISLEEPELINNEELLACLENALQQLPPDDRGLVQLFYMQEKSIDEIGLITNLSIANVKTKLHRIRKKLFKMMHTIN